MLLYRLPSVLTQRTRLAYDEYGDRSHHHGWEALKELRGVFTFTDGLGRGVRLPAVVVAEQSQLGAFEMPFSEPGSPRP